ncbi:MAG: MBL fold metallo-hydrolase [Polyangiaceae bacterium]
MTSRSVIAVAGLALLLSAFAACKSPPDQPPPPPPVSSAPPLSSKAARALPDSPQTELGATDSFSTTTGLLEIVPIHHASVLFKWHGKSIYVDPVTNLETLPKADYIFITHAHPDHLDEATLARLKMNGTQVVGPPAVAEKTHVDVVLKNGDTKDLTDVKVEAVPAYNIVRGPSKDTRYHPKGDGNGYVITFGDKRIYLSGDTECTPEMKALKNIDGAFLCMNLPYTETTQEAAECTLAFKPKVVFPYHWQEKDPSLPPQKPEDFKSQVAAKDPSIDVRIRRWY